MCEDGCLYHRFKEKLRCLCGDVERCSLRDRRVYKEGRLSYADFVWFLISEEDKKTDTR